jgi:hypothetical protein
MMTSPQTRSSFQTMTNPISPEIELLLYCARTTLSELTTIRVRALIQAGVNWELLLQQSVQQGVLALLYQNLNTVGTEFVPSPVLEQLRHHYQRNQVKSTLLSQELLRLLVLLSQHFVFAIPLNGLVLAAMAYGDLALRQIDDLTILVHEQDYLRAKILLLAHGDRPSHSSIDLHERLLRGQWSTERDDLQQLGDRLEPVEFGDQAVLTAKPENLLLYLCVQGNKHHWSRLAEICDVAELIRSFPQLDWQMVLTAANRLHIEEMLFLGLFLANEWLDAPLPELVKQQMQQYPNSSDQALQILCQLSQVQSSAQHDKTPSTIADIAIESGSETPGWLRSVAKKKLFGAMWRSLYVWYSTVRPSQPLSELDRTILIQM